MFYQIGVGGKRPQPITNAHTHTYIHTYTYMHVGRRHARRMRNNKRHCQPEKPPPTHPTCPLLRLVVHVHNTMHTPTHLWFVVPSQLHAYFMGVACEHPHNVSKVIAVTISLRNGNREGDGRGQMQQAFTRAHAHTHTRTHVRVHAHSLTHKPTHTHAHTLTRIWSPQWNVTFPRLKEEYSRFGFVSIVEPQQNGHHTHARARQYYTGKHR